MMGCSSPFVSSLLSSFNPTRFRVCCCWFLLFLLISDSFVSRSQDDTTCKSSSIVVSAFSTTPPSSSGSSSPSGNKNNNEGIKKAQKSKYNKDDYSWLDKEKYTWREKKTNSNGNENRGAHGIENRGARYESLNSTIPTATEAAIKVGVEPPLNASAQAWKRAWIIHRIATPWLHKFDKYAPPDSKLCLMCLWWKALSGNNRKSPVFDDKLHYDMLPSISRRVLRGPLKWFYPRLHHSNVEIRTAYLDQAVRKAISMVQSSQGSKKKIRLISMGAGYDLRSVKFRLQGLIDKAYELDLPEVVDSKSLLLKERLQGRRPDEIPDDILPKLYKVDLNDIDQFESTIQDILQTEAQEDNDDWHTIFLFEAVMIYLNEGIPTSLLQVCHKFGSQLQEGTDATATLCFADRLEDIPGAALKIAHPVLEATGWHIVEWHPKPGLARHMGMLVPLK